MEAVEPLKRPRNSNSKTASIGGPDDKEGQLYKGHIQFFFHLHTRIHCEFRFVKHIFVLTKMRSRVYSACHFLNSFHDVSAIEEA